MFDRLGSGQSAERRAPDASRVFRLPPSALRPHTSGFTLIELLVVVSIMVILLGLVATRMPSTKEGRRTRETARLINAYLSSARNRAIETGRPCGVTFRNFGTGAAMNADQCEVPPSFCGETELSFAQIQVDTSTTSIAMRLFDTGNPFYMISGLNLVRPGDLIQFNCQGPMYRIHYGAAVTEPIPKTPPNNLDVNRYIITDASSPDIYASLSNLNQNTMVPWPKTPGWSPYVPYRIFRSPIKGYAQPLQMPVPAVVDLTASGLGTYFAGAGDFTIMFSPTGAVDCVYYGATRVIAGDMIYLLVGSNERVANGYTPDNANVDTLTNYQDMNNRWVTINPQTGAVQTDLVAALVSGLNETQAKIAARAIAVEGVGMGGN